MRPTMSVRRVLICYVITLIAVVVGSPVAILGYVKGDQCTGGSSCLRILPLGLLGAGLLAAVALLVLAIIFRAGVIFWLSALAVAIVPTLISNHPYLPQLAALAAPGIAAWVAHPPRRRLELTRTPVRLALSRLVVLVLFILVVPVMLRVL